MFFPGEHALTLEQERTLNHLAMGESALVTGPAGTGKSMVVDAWRQRETRAIAVTASTGIAALNLGGRTLHSWAGIGTGEKSARHVTRNRYWRMYTQPRIAWAQAVVVDEVSMIVTARRTAPPDLVRAMQAASGR